MVNSNQTNVSVKLQERCQQEWLIGYHSRLFYQIYEDYLEQFTLLKVAHKIPKILLFPEQPFPFLAAFLAAIAAKCHLFLGNPNWTQPECEQVIERIGPNLVLGHHQRKSPPTTSMPPSSDIALAEPLIMIPTGGTSGNIRFAMHTWKTLHASVRGFQSYFQVTAIHSFCLLPLYHVSGLMQFIRSFLTGGKFYVLPYATLKHHLERAPLNHSGAFQTTHLVGGKQFEPSQYFVSLVPTQLQHVLKFAPQWLATFHGILLGGTPAWPSLLAQARQAKLPLSLTYGMTETASQIVTLKAADFLQGNFSSGQVLPHAQVQIQDPQGISLPSQQVGAIAIQAASRYLGYYPDYDETNPYWVTDDLGYFDEAGYLHVVGRQNRTIMTGGEKVFPNEVEAAILATPYVQDVCVIGIKDEHWGEAITAIYVPNQEVTPISTIQTSLQGALSPYKCPKHWLAVKAIARNAQGKVVYHTLKEMAQSHFDPLE